MSGRPPIATNRLPDPVCVCVCARARAADGRYVHRVGRTARMDAQGNALIFLLPSESEYLKVLDDCKFTLVELPFAAILSRLAGKPTAGAALSDATKDAATSLQLQFERAVQQDAAALGRAAALAHTSYIRAYSTYPSEQKHIFHVKSLHLGHVAKSFALRSPPGAIAASGAATDAADAAVALRKGREKKALAVEDRATRKRKNVLDEFASTDKAGAPATKKKRLLVR